MQLSTLCLGLLLTEAMTGYALQRKVIGALGHLQHASFGALYSALGSLEVGGFVTSARSGSTALGKRLCGITVSGRAEFTERLDD